VVAQARYREARTESILSAADLVVRTAPMIGGGRVTVASSERQGASVVSLRADEAPSADRAFQMWKIRGTGRPVSAGVLPAGQASTVQVVDGVPGNDVFAVSVEPAGGSSVPTSSRIVTQVPLT
jgi:anti-sigma-K factor RskA